jgi:hypothetical protein
MIKSDKIREYFRKHPGADVAKVAAKFQASKPMTYKMRKQVQDEWNPPAPLPMPEVDTEAPEPGRKFDAGKLDYTLVPFEGLEEIIKVLMFGAQKYDRHNWKHVDNAQQRYTAAAFRHMAAHAKGEKNDPETGLSHLAHAGCCVLFLLALEQQEAP